MRDGDCCRFPKSRYFVAAVNLCVFSAAFLIVSFSSPYWLESYDGTVSEFVRMGLWTVCFQNYKHSTIRFDHVLDGCNWLFSYKYQEIRSWLQPVWFILVQVLMCFGLVFSVVALVLVIILCVRSVNTFRVLILATAFVLSAISALTVFLAISVFGSMCFDRAWIQHPTYNHLSWSYGMALIGFICEGCASAMLLADAFHARRQVYRADIVYTSATEELQ